jgi:sulfofructose kinase
VGEYVGDHVPFRPAVVFAGAAVMDTIALVSRFPRPDERLVADDLVQAGGGPAATAAVAAARLGVRTAFVGSVGDDGDGHRILDGLRAENVDVAGVSMVAGARSAASVVVVDSVRDTRAICTRLGPAALLNDAAARLLAGAEWVHVDHVGWAPVRRILGALPEWRRPRLSVDAGNPIDDLDMARVDLFVPTLAALARRYGNRGVDAQLVAALDEGANQVVVTRGPAGCLAATRDGQRYAAPGHHVDVLSTVGAGDVFHGALLAAVVRGMPPPDCLRYANVTAALSCRGVDGRSAIPTDAQVLDELRKSAPIEGES